MIKKNRIQIVVIFSLFLLILTKFINDNNRKIVYELVEAIKVNDEETIEKCMSKSFNINIIYREGQDAYAQTPLSIACNYGKFDLIRKMVLEKGADVNYTPEESTSPISSIFCLYGEEKHTLHEYIAIYDFLIEKGANFKKDSPLKCFGVYLILEEFIQNIGEENTIKLIDYLFENGVEYEDSKIISAASIINNINVLKYLIESKNIKINYGERYDRFALLFAVDEPSYECAEYLVSVGFRQDILFNAGEYENLTAREIAIKKNDKRMIEILENTNR